VFLFEQLVNNHLRINVTSRVFVKKPIHQTVSPRPVTSLGHQVWRKVFWEGPKFFKLCPIVFNYAQKIFPGVRKGFQWGGFAPLPPWSRACVQ